MPPLPWWSVSVCICVCKAVSVPYSEIDMPHRAWKAALEPDISALTPLLNVKLCWSLHFETLHPFIHGYILNDV